MQQLWDEYEPITKRDNASYGSDRGRAVHLLRHLGDREGMKLGRADVERYRTTRLGEKTRRKKPPSNATLNLLHDTWAKMNSHSIR